MHRDGFAWVVDVAQLAGAIIGVVAIVLAVAANRNARRAETRSRDALVRERRIDFQLNLLKDLAEHNLQGRGVTRPSRQRFDLTASLLPLDLVPLARAVAGLKSTPDARERVKTFSRGKQSDVIRSHFADDIHDEIAAAIERLLAERHGGDVEQRSPWWQRIRGK